MKRTFCGWGGILAGFLAATAVLRADTAKLEEVASFGRNQPIGMAVSSDPNRVFVSFPHREPFLHALTEIGLVLFIITLLVNAGSRVLIWAMSR